MRMMVSRGVLRIKSAILFTGEICTVFADLLSGSLFSVPPFIGATLLLSFGIMISAGFSRPLFGGKTVPSLNVSDFSFSLSTFLSGWTFSSQSR
jgi:hypothetical protein